MNINRKILVDCATTSEEDVVRIQIPFDQSRGWEGDVLIEGCESQENFQWSDSSWLSSLKLSIFCFLMPLPILGLTWLLGLRSGGWMFVIYLTMLGGEGWVVWRCVQDTCRYMMSGEADRVRDDEPIINELKRLDDLSYQRDLYGSSCSRN